MSDVSFTDRKMCPQCGHSNRISAKVCTNCGYNFAEMTWAESEPASPSVVQVVPLKRCPECGHENRVSAKVCTNCGHRFRVGSAGQKWCPKCGTVNRLEAKVCINCGHRFRTDFTRTAPEPSVAPRSKITEPPIVQTPPPAITLPTQFEEPPRLPDPPPEPVKPPPSKATPVKPPVPSLEELLDEPKAKPKTDTADLSGEPAPDLTDLDLDDLRHNRKDRS